MTTKKTNEDILDSVEENRRDFIRTLIVGTTFAVPLLASFSMDGGIIGEAEADTAFSSNMSCSNMTYAGPDKFKAHLTGVDTTSQGQAVFRLTDDIVDLTCRLNVSSNLQFVNAGIYMDNIPALTPLPKGSSVINEDIINPSYPCPLGSSRLNSLLVAMADGNAEVRVILSDGVNFITISGIITPVGS
jgi:hypothetical protein